jgi:hypothetical protein
VAILDGLKAAADTLRTADKIAEYQQILSAMQTIAELQLQVQECRLHESNLAAELEAIKADQLNAAEMQEFYQLFKLNGRYYCPHCWIVDKRLGPVVFIEAHSIQCTRCKQKFAWTSNPIDSSLS